MLLKSAIRYLLFRKAGEQLGLFDIPVPIKPYVRDGKVIAGHVAKRKKRIAPKGKQPDLFGAPEPQGEAVKLGRLGHFIEKHGGYGRLHAMLQGYTDDQRNTLLDSMAKLAGKTRAEVADILANGAKHEVPKAVEGDLFAGVEVEVPKDNQGRDLAAVKRTKEQEAQRAEEGRAASRAMHEATIKDVPLPDWTTVNGQEVLRSGDSKFVAAPRNGKRTAANFDVLDMEANEHVLTLPKDEVYKWLHASAKAEFEDKHGRPAGSREPQEGDTKTEDGIEYRLSGGRWHRTTPDEKPAFTPTHELPDGTQVVAHADEANVWVDAQGDEYESEEAYTLSDDPTDQIDNKLDQQEARWIKPEYSVTKREKPKDSLAQLRDKIDAMGGKAQVAENLRTAFKDRLTRPQAEAVINELAAATGLDRDTVLAEMGIREVTRKPSAERSRPDTLSTGGEYSDDDPNSPNYRFRDTGYIGDSRKELAADSIREHARNGRRLRATDIDWEEIERNPRQAKELITKSNLFGKVDWDALKANGMEPATGFLIDRVYASIAPEPSGDDAQARKDYAVGLESLRDRLESCKTPENVTDVLEELRDEYDGIIFNEREKAAYEQALAIHQEISNRRWELKKELDALQQAAHRITGKINSLSWEQEKRERRKWKRDPEVDKQIEALRPEQELAIQAVEAWKAAHPEAEERYEQESGTDAQGHQHVRMRLRGGLYEQEQAAREVMQTIRAFSLSRNREENPLHRAWQLMGPKFLTVLKWRSGKNAFQGHVTSAKTGKIKDWSWAEKQHVTAPRATAGKVRFQLRVAEQFSRVGGRPVEVNSTDELKRRYGLRDVQSGNWVLTDPESAAFHVQHAAEALSDLSDLLGIPEDKLFVNGRVALAFGARGQGNAGFGGAARAHYERIHRVINLTKLGGGGALAHELFHAIDNLAKEAETGQPGDSEDFITDNPDLLPEGRLKNAVRDLRSAMLEGDKRMWQTLKYSAKDARDAKYNLDRASPSKMAAAIKDAPDLESALLAIDSFYPRGWDGKRTARQREDWRRIAAAWHGGMNPEGGMAQARAGAPVSDFTYQAHLLDGGQYGKYWSSTREMAARAFQAWCEDRLSDQGRKNDYLSAFADNQYYKDPLFGDSKPFPEGLERERINVAIDELVAALREGGTLRKAFELLAA